MSEEQGKYTTREEVDEALEMLGKGYGLEIHRPARVVKGTRDGLKEYKTPVWIKLSTTFREVMKNLKGSRLAVFLDICLHIDENNDCFPSLETIAKETGYSKRETINAIQELESLDLLTVRRGEKRYNIYHVNAAAAIGAENAPVHFTTLNGELSARKMSQSALKEEPIKRDVNEKTTTNENTPNVFEAYESNIGPLTPMIADALEDAERVYPANWLIDVIRLAVENNKRNWKYCIAILERWQVEGKDNGKKPGRTSGKLPPVTKSVADTWYEKKQKELQHGRA